jgi:hypothetical protein
MSRVSGGGGAGRATAGSGRACGVAGAAATRIVSTDLYPMNALANDQRRRLGERWEAPAGNDSPFRFTFGRYETATSQRRRRR